MVTKNVKSVSLEGSVHAAVQWIRPSYIDSNFWWKHKREVSLKAKPSEDAVQSRAGTFKLFHVYKIRFFLAL